MDDAALISRIAQGMTTERDAAAVARCLYRLRRYEVALSQLIGTEAEASEAIRDLVQTSAEGDAQLIGSGSALLRWWSNGTETPHRRRARRRARSRSR
jgi:hypothetical protein